MVEFNYLDYCRKCAGNLSKVNDTVYLCQKCGNKTFNSPVGAAAIVVFKGDSVLLAVRGIEPDKGKLDTIGGFIDWMEDPEEAAKREFIEETGSEITNLKLFAAATTPYTQNMSVINVMYTGDIDESAELTPKDDVAELRWFKVEDLDKSQFGGASYFLDHIKKGHRDWTNS